MLAKVKQLYYHTMIVINLLIGEPLIGGFIIVAVCYIIVRLVFNV